MISGSTISAPCGVAHVVGITRQKTSHESVPILADVADECKVLIDVYGYRKNLDKKTDLVLYGNN
jgi:hypothetical protein